MRTLELVHAALPRTVVEHTCMLLVGRNVTLTDLDLAHAYIEDKGARLLARALHLNKSLVSEPPIRSPRAPARLCCVPCPPLLCALPASAVSPARLWSALLAPSALPTRPLSAPRTRAVKVRLALAHNRLSSDSGVALADTLRINCTLTQAR
eukprot:2328541-Prymnesium_polylepis.1